MAAAADALAAGNPVYESLLSSGTVGEARAHLADRAFARRIMRGINGLFHLAGRRGSVGIQRAQGATMLGENLTICLNTLDAAQRAGVERVLDRREQGTIGLDPDRAGDLPTVEVAASVLAEGVALAVLATDIGLTASRGEARRLAQGGGLRLNDAQEKDGDRLVTNADLIDGVVKLSQGKKKIVLVKPV